MADSPPLELDDLHDGGTALLLPLEDVRQQEGDGEGGGPRHDILGCGSDGHTEHDGADGVPHGRLLELLQLI